MGPTPFALLNLQGTTQYEGLFLEIFLHSLVYSKTKRKTFKNYFFLLDNCRRSLPNVWGGVWLPQVLKKSTQKSTQKSEITYKSTEFCVTKSLKKVLNKVLKKVKLLTKKN